MAPARQCILCETVHASSQEMEEHMRSMLHHRELEKLKGRDCGHECRVCKVTVVSLTEYASHISSATHKQKVEASELKACGKDTDDYFDRALVEMIEKRKEQIRKDKEAAAAKEEERKRKEEFQQRLQQTKERYRLECGWQQSSRWYNGQHNNWMYQHNSRPGEQKPWHNNQGKSATWHAQEPPNFNQWAPDNYHGRWEDRRQDYGFANNQQCRLPWLSRGGSSYGVYGQNNISQYSHRGRGNSFNRQSRTLPPNTFNRPLNPFPNTANEQKGHQSESPQNVEGRTTEPDLKGNKGPKGFGSNPKLDKTCRWSPYPVTKDTASTEKNHNTTKAQNHNSTSENSASNRLSQSEQKLAPLPSSGLAVKESQKHKTKVEELKSRGESCTRSSSSSSRSSSSSSSSSSAQKEGHVTPTSASSSQNTAVLSKEKKIPSLPTLLSVAPLSKVLSPGDAQSKPVAKQSGLSSKAASFGSLKSRQQPQLPETLCKARLTSSEKRSSLDSSKNKKDVSQPIMEKQQMDVAQSQIGVNKENTCRQNTAPPYSPGSVRPERPLLLSSESSQFLQSLQVSTSTVECSDAAASNKKHEETRLKDNEKSSSTDPDESLQAAEEGYGSGREPCKGAEAQSISGSSSNLSKLDLPTVLKRDLTKHMSSKNKTGSHEPNLNIARRVRNLSESRRSDSEKESGLKPTVRQLISSSGSRRNVNWEQVYQEVRKKQDKGKGMPRFGIEMVPNEVEDQSQEEDDIPLLEGEHWEALLGISAPAPRKRSLSESSLVPESTSAIFTSLISKETSQRESLSPKQQKPSVISMDTSGSKDVHCQQLTERKTQREPEKLMAASVKPLQRSDSVLGDSSSGTEQFDGTGTGKRRRATVDAPSTDTSCLGHNSKRRKVKSKQERSHIDQLLAVSLREDELSRSLQTTDNSLIQARAALEAAYMEVQRLMVVKQQMTAEMSTLRNKRIELLKGMQGSLEEAPQVTVKEERMHTTDADSGIMFSPAMDMSAAEATPPAVATSHPPNPSPTASLHHPPSPSHSFTPIMIKQEPQSPVHATPELDPVEYKALCAHSTTPEVPVAPEVPGFTSKSSPKRSPDFYQTHTDHSWEKFEDPGDCKQSLSGLVESTEKASQTAGSCLMPMSDCKPLKPLSSSRLSSELDSVADCTASKFPEPLPVPSVFNLPAPPSDLTNGKRVRKLKKRKVLKKAQVPEQPESSDTEIDIEPLRRRWSRPRRRPSGGSQVTTSSVTVDETNMENGEEAQQQLSPANKHEEAEPPASAPPELTENLDSEENMEVTTDCRKSNTESHAPEPTSVKVKDFSRAELQNLACNEVTSTSDMDICKSSESDLPFPISMSRSLRSQSDASSDHGGDELATEGLFEGHQEAVNAMQIHSGLLYTCSGDRTVRAFDLVSHECVAVFEGHSSKVSCLLVSTAPSLHHRLYTGSSDQTVRCYSLKTQEFEHQFSLSDRVLCLHSRWRTLYVGLANGTVVTINLKTNKQMDVFECHGPRAVSCLASSQEGARRILLVGSYDNTISVRDAKNGLLLRTLEGHTKTVLCLKVINDLVFSGSSDHCVYTHNIHTGELLWVFKGHTHAVTVVTVLGKVMVTACLDKLVRVYDLQSQEQLQVYGGHKDMVMCMTVHKNMIYTGCYDGSVEAVKLNLMQNHRCWWHGCSLVYGVTEHLQQHLINDHGSANVQKLKCRWKKCEEVFSVRNGSKQRAMLLHMQKHAEETDLKP